MHKRMLEKWKRLKNCLGFLVKRWISCQRLKSRLLSLEFDWICLTKLAFNLKDRVTLQICHRWKSYNSSAPRFKILR